MAQEFAVVARHPGKEVELVGQRGVQPLGRAAVASERELRRSTVVQAGAFRVWLNCPTRQGPDGSLPRRIHRSMV